VTTGSVVLNPGPRVPKQGSEVTRMPYRYCRACDADVEDAGGYCLLGHPLRLDAPMPSVAEMRDEVSRALGEARPEGHASEAHTDGEPAPEVADARLDTPPPPDIRATVWHSLEDTTPETADPITAFAPPPRMDWGPEQSGLRRRNPLRRRQRHAPPDPVAILEAQTPNPSQR
jgi:hypothetical protein